MYSNKIDETMQAVKEVRAYEEACVTETTHLIALLGGLQKTMNAAKSANLLQESLRYIKEAETQEEMEVYHASFLAALETVKLKDLLDIDACVNVLRECADDLFYWTNLEADRRIKQLGSNAILNDTVGRAQQAVTYFMQHVNALQGEFQQQITKNNELIVKISASDQTAIKEDYVAHQEKISELKHLNMKYQMGLQRIDTQKLQISHALGIVEKIPTAITKVEKQNTRADLAIALHEVRLIDSFTGYNHFVAKCKHNVDALFTVRSSYVKKEESGLKSFGKSLWNGAALALHLVAVPVIPAELPSFAHESVSSTMELSDHIIEPKVRNELRRTGTVSEAPRLSPLQKVGNFFKKTASVLLGVGGLALSGLLCLTGIGIPKGLVLASASLGALNAVKKGSDIFTESTHELKYNKNVTPKLDSLERQHAELRQQVQTIEKTNRKSVERTTMQQLSSESKIDLLLMGHKQHDLLSEEDIAKISHAHYVADSEELAQQLKKDEAPQMVNGKNNLPNFISVVQEEEGEGETDFRPRAPGVA